MGLMLGAAVMRPRLAWSAVPREADIVVIGAGAAGIAAARKIAAAGRKVVVVEASGAIGGRCRTDSTTFDMPFDRGARWLYNPDTNPVVKPARAAGLEIAPAPQGQKIRIGRRFARAGEVEDSLATLVRANRAIDDAARRGDIACAAVLPKDLGDWAGTIEFLLGAFASGKDLRDFSVGDQVHGEHRDTSASARRGLGPLMIAHCVEQPRRQRRDGRRHDRREGGDRHGVEQRHHLRQDQVHAGSAEAPARRRGQTQPRQL
jgi:choline dehydrogenase-like flavoprotein